MSLQNQTFIAKQTDLESIFSIYNWYVENTTASLETRKFSEKEQEEWFEQFSENYPLLALKSESGEVLGWACLKKWSDRPGYKKTVENSIYMSPDHLGKGLGLFLMEELLLRAQSLKYRTVLARIGQESVKSIEFHKKFGFFEVGTMKSVGFKFNKELDVVLLQKML